MPVKKHEGRPRPEPLAGRVPEGATAEQVADATVALWRDIDAALHPIIGHRGVAALYNRSLRLSSAAHPWLAGGYPDAAALDATALCSALARQPAAEAAAASQALYQTFHALLASLVGAALTDQLLQPVWAHPAGTPPAQDTPS